MVWDRVGLCLRTHATVEFARVFFRGGLLPCGCVVDPLEEWALCILGVFVGALDKLAAWILAVGPCRQLFLWLAIASHSAIGEQTPLAVVHGIT